MVTVAPPVASHDSAQVRRESSKIRETVLPIVPLEGLPLRRFTLDEYHHLIDIGFFDEDERVELLEGVLVYMSPNNPPHIRTVLRLFRFLVSQITHEDIEVRAQGPISIPELMTEPEPDLVISKESGGTLDERHPYPADILLLMEVSDSSLAYDRTRKAEIYVYLIIGGDLLEVYRDPHTGIPDYWIWNLVDNSLEVYRDPHAPAIGGVRTLSDEIDLSQRRVDCAPGIS